MTREELLAEATRLERQADETLQAAMAAIEPEEAGALRAIADELRAESAALCRRVSAARGA